MHYASALSFYAFLFNYYAQLSTFIIPGRRLIQYCLYIYRAIHRLLSLLRHRKINVKSRCEIQAFD